MQSSNLVLLIKSFSKTETREVRRFLESPFFNLRDDLVALFDFIGRQENPNKEAAWAALHSEKKYDDTSFRLLMSYLNRLLEQYLIFKENEEQTLQNELLLAKAYRRRGLKAPYSKTLRAFEKKLKKQPLRNVGFEQLQRDLSYELQETQTTENPTDASAYQTLIDTTDAHYLSARLRLLCLEAAQKSVYRSAERQLTDEDIIALAKLEKWSKKTAIQLYLAAYQMLSTPREDALFYGFSKLVEAHETAFKAEEMREFYLFAINHCVRRINEGQAEFGAEALQLYRRALERGYLFENGLLSRFAYHNIVAAGLRANELDWVHDFIHQYKSHLARKYRESSFSFNLARLELAQSRYDSVLLLLQNANYRDPLLNLAAKVLLMKTYHALDEHDLLQSHLDAMRNYIHRKAVIGYHKTNYLNIVRCMERFLQLNRNDKSDVEKWKEQVASEAVLTEKKWFLGLG